MENSEFKRLVKRYLSGQASAEEEEYLFNYYDKLQETGIAWDDEEMGDQDEVKNRVYQHALDQMEKQSKPGLRFFSTAFIKWSMAAAVITLVSVASYFYLQQPEQSVIKVARKPKPAIQDVLPGGNKAILTLADGSQIVLDNAKDGRLTSQGDIAITKSKDGQLIYQVADKGGNLQGQELAYNTIRTPVGGQYQVVLSDDTKVWLNAGSSIRFPTTFSARERMVEVEGEAYFEVAKDKKRPFRVKSDNQLIEVLGTHFNVNAYQDEALVKTTLLEGSVKISSGGENIVIKPGQQSRLSRSKHHIDVVKVDLEEAVAWKNGLFVFNDEEIHSIMRKISRWYGINVVYKDDSIEETFGGTVSRFENVSQVLKILEVTGTIHFKIVPGDKSGKGRRIIVMK